MAYGKASPPNSSWTVGSGAGKGAAPWFCHGTANVPHSLSYPPGLAWDAKQVCSGDFGVQKVCVYLQQLDYYGHWTTVSVKWCSRETVAMTQYAGDHDSCANAGHGTYRTLGMGYAWPDGVQHTAGAYSGSAVLC
jgi:hypothetical protein